MSSVCFAARLRRDPSFQRLTGFSVTTFDEMLSQLTGPWGRAQARKIKPGRPWDMVIWKITFWSC